jgi:Holliday junction resolvase
MSRKSRGINAERDLIHKFNENEWVAFRAAGSGSMKYACPDIIAGNNLRKIAIEVKLTTEEKKYFTKEEIKDLVFFANRFGAEAWVAVKFFREDWLFLTIEDLEETPKNYVADLKVAKRRGLSFEELIKA